MNKQEQVWMSIFSIIPVIFLGNTAVELVGESNNSILFAGLGGGIGGILGYGIYYFTSKYSNLVKISITILLLGILTSMTYFVVNNNDHYSDDDWKSYNYGNIEFQSPTKLTLFTDELAKGTEPFIEKIAIYNDGNKDRSLTYVISEWKSDTITVESQFISLLEGMLSPLQINDESFIVDSIYQDEEEMSVFFDYERNGKDLTGYGYMFKKGSTLESLWLIPINSNFPEGFIEKFDLEINPDY